MVGGVHGMAIAQRGRMSDRWQVDKRLAAPWIGRRLIPLLALCVLLVGAGGLILWATGSNSAAGVSPSVTALVQTSNELVEKTGALETTEQQTIDQLQVVQDQLASQQAETKRLTGEIEALHAKLDALAQSASEMTAPSAGAAVPSPKTARKGRN
jgi:septal ring factor EnvC (AmiA/AmiB activator)